MSYRMTKLQAMHAHALARYQRQSWVKKFSAAQAAELTLEEMKRSGGKNLPTVSDSAKEALVSSTKRTDFGWVAWTVADDGMASLFVYEGASRNPVIGALIHEDKYAVFVKMWRRLQERHCKALLGMAKALGCKPSDMKVNAQNFHLGLLTSLISRR